MRGNRQISDEAREAVAVVVAPRSHQKPHHARKKMAGGLDLSMRRELLERMLPHHQEASSADKRQLLDDFTRLTGYHRRYAMSLFEHHTGQRPQSPDPPCPRRYDSEVEEALVQVWNQANRPCGKRLIPFLPTAIGSLERHGHLHLSEECRTHLLSVSAATADRLLRPQAMRGLSTTRAGTLLKSNIPIRTFEQWDEQIPGLRYR